MKKPVEEMAEVIGGMVGWILAGVALGCALGVFAATVRFVYLALS